MFPLPVTGAARGAVLAVALLAAGCGPTTLVDAGGTVAEERSFAEIKDDTRIKIEINKRLARTDGAPFLAVGTDVYTGRVLLTGAVDTPEAKTVAVRLAREVEGVVEVLDHLRVAPGGGIAGTANDTWIETQAKAKLLAAKGVRSVNYRWRAVGGTVYVIGLAHDQAELDRVLSIVRGIERVRDVVSHVRVGS
jgi:osmotically-inducible protein OsmY